MTRTVAYHRPASLGRALQLLSTLDGGAVPVAGGTDVLVDLRRGLYEACHLVSLRDVPELKGIRREKGTLWIGALTTPAEIAASDDVAAACPGLLDAVRAFGSPQVRNRATIGGNLCNATSCADLPPILLACGASASLAGPGGGFSVPLEEFFVDARKTVRDPTELLLGVHVPLQGAGEGAAYVPFGRRAATYITVAGVAAWVRLDGGLCRAARIVLGAVGPTPIVAHEAAACLIGRLPQGDALGQVAIAAREAAQPIADVRGGAGYRRDLVEILTRRALEGAIERTRA